MSSLVHNVVSERVETRVPNPAANTSTAKHVNHYPDERADLRNAYLK